MSENLTQSTTTPGSVAATVVAPEQEYAGFWIRFAARIVDGVILGLIGLAIGSIVGSIVAAMTPEYVESNQIIADEVTNSVQNTEDPLAAVFGTIQKAVDCSYDSQRVVDACKVIATYTVVSGAITGVLTTLVYIAYFVVATASNMQGTLGKKLLKVKVVDDNGQRITLAQSFTREVFPLGNRVFDILGLFFAPLSWVAGLFSLTFVVSSIFVAFDEKKQALHDKIAKTFVVKAE